MTLGIQNLNAASPNAFPPACCAYFSALVYPFSLLYLCEISVVFMAQVLGFCIPMLFNVMKRLGNIGLIARQKSLYCVVKETLLEAKRAYIAMY